MILKRGVVKWLAVVVLIAGLVSITNATCLGKKKVAEPQPVATGGDNPDARPLDFPTEDSVLADIHFGYDKSDLTSDAKQTLDQHASWLNTNPTSQLQVEGHCDERGTEEYNLALGERRANAVKDYLAAQGVDSARIYTISYGEELPVAPGHDEAAWKQNRRAHFLVTYK